MIARIVEAFTKGYCEMTAVDGLIVGVVILSLLYPVVWFMGKTEQ